MALYESHENEQRQVIPFVGCLTGFLTRRTNRFCIYFRCTGRTSGGGYWGKSPSIPPLVCSEHACNKDWSLEHTPVDSTPPTMEFGWWEDFWSDSDSNGFDDRLQMILAGERESVSLTSIIGSDGRPTVAIIVHYAWHPGPTDIESLEARLSRMGGNRMVLGSWSWIILMQSFWITCRSSL